MYTIQSDKWYYFKQGSNVKRFKSIRDGEKVKISIKSQRFNFFIYIHFKRREEKRKFKRN